LILHGGDLFFLVTSRFQVFSHRRFQSLHLVLDFERFSHLFGEYDWLAIVDQSAHVVVFFFRWTVATLRFAVKFICLLQVILSLFYFFFDFVDCLVDSHQLISLHYAILALLKISVRVFYLGLEALQVGLLYGHIRVHLEGARVDLNLRL